MPLRRFRLWLFPPATPVTERATVTPVHPDDALTPVVADVEIPPERRALLEAVQARHHQILNRFQGYLARRDRDRLLHLREMDPS